MQQFEHSHAIRTTNFDLENDAFAYMGPLVGRVPSIKKSSLKYLTFYPKLFIRRYLY